MSSYTIHLILYHLQGLQGIPLYGFSYKLKRIVSHSVVPRPAASAPLGYVLEMQILRPHLRPAKSGVRTTTCI